MKNTVIVILILILGYMFILQSKVDDINTSLRQEIESLEYDKKILNNGFIRNWMMSNKYRSLLEENNIPIPDIDTIVEDRNEKVYDVLH